MFREIIDVKKYKKILRITTILTGTAFIGLRIIAKKRVIQLMMMV